MVLRSAGLDTRSAGNLARIVAVEAGHEIYGISALRLGRSKVVTHKRQTLKFLKSWFFSLTWPHVNNTPKSIRPTTSVLTLWHGSTGIKSSDYTHYEHKVAIVCKTTFRLNRKSNFFEILTKQSIWSQFRSAITANIWQFWQALRPRFDRLTGCPFRDDLTPCEH